MTSTDIMPLTRKDFLLLPDGRRIRQIRVFIHQPKLYSAPLEKVLTIPEILAFAAEARAAARRVEEAARHHKIINIADWNREYLNPNPNDEECAFCRATAVCPAGAEKVRQVITPLGAIEDLDDVPERKPSEKPEVTAARRAATTRLLPESMEHLNEAAKAIPFIEDWCLAVRAELERRMLAGEEAPDFGLELGRRGARAFTDPDVVTEMLRKKFRLKEKDVFNFKLKTPTQLEELTKPSIDEETNEIVPPALGEKRWAKVSEFIHQKDPVPSVKRKSVIKTPYAVPAPTPLSAIPDDDEEHSDDNLLY